MENKGFIRKFDSFGRIVLPIQFRKALDVTEDTDLDIFMDGDRIIIKKHSEDCQFCGSNTNLFAYKGKFICLRCKNALTKI